MPRSIYINLAVTDVAASTKFYSSLGATINPQFSDATTSCIIFSDTINIMIMTHAKFKSFMPASKEIADSTKFTETLLCISADSKEEIDIMVEAAAKEGGKKDPTTFPEMPGMYGRTFEDLDGHLWELMYMDVEACKAHWEAVSENP